MSSVTMYLILSHNEGHKSRVIVYKLSQYLPLFIVNGKSATDTNSVTWQFITPLRLSRVC